MPFETLRPVQKVSRHRLRKIETVIEEETLYMEQLHLSSLPLGLHTVLPASLPLFKTLGKNLCWNCNQLPHRIFLNLIDSLKSLPFQM